jgi:hypothetical protein
MRAAQNWQLAAPVPAHLGTLLVSNRASTMLGDGGHYEAVLVGNSSCIRADIASRERQLNHHDFPYPE